MTEVNPCFPLSGKTHAAEVVRDVIHALRLGAGVVGSNDLEVSQTPTPSMAVQVSSGRAVIGGTEGMWQGSYVVRNDGTVTLPITPADPSLARQDLVVARVHDADYSGATSAWALEVVTGTPGGGDPATPASSLVLARVSVGPGATSIANANITDLRTFARSKIVPGPAGLHVRDSADTRDNLTVGDGGDLTIRGNLWIPPAPGGAIAPSAGGSTLVKIAETTLTATVASVTFGSIPSTFRHLLILASSVRCDQINSRWLCVRFNGDATSGDYAWVNAHFDTSNLNWLNTGNVLDSKGLIGVCAKNQTLFYGSQKIWIFDYTQTTLRIGWRSASSRDDGVLEFDEFVGGWKPNVLQVINQITLFPDIGNLIAPSRFCLYGVP